MKTNIETDRRAIIKGSAWLSLSGYLSGFLWYLFFFVLARKVGVEDFGRFTLALTFVSLFSFTMDIGLSPLAQREIARNKGLVDVYFPNVMGLKVFLVILSICLIGILLNILNYTAVMRKTIYILSAAEGLNSFSDFFRSVFRANQKMHYEVSIWVAEKVMVLSIGTAALYMGKGILTVASIVLLAALIKFLVGFALMKKRFVGKTAKPSVIFLKDVTKKGFVIGFVYMLGLLYFKVDTVMLSYMVSDESVGLYNASYKLLEGLMVLSTAFGGVLYPLLSSLCERDRNRFMSVSQAGIKYLLMVSLPTASFVTLAAGEIIRIFFGPAYSAGTSSLQVLIWTFLFQSVGLVTTASLLAMGQERRLIIILAFTVIVNMVLNYFTIPILHELGAALTTVISEALLAILSFYALSSLDMKISLPDSTYRIIMTVMVLTIFNIVAAKWLSFFVIGPLLIFLYIISYTGLRLLSIDDIKSLVGMPMPQEKHKEG